MRYDIILKSLFQASHVLESLTGSSVREWLNVEIPSPRMSRLDLVAWLSDGRLYHLELQSQNDAEMPHRMLDYYSLLWKKYGVQPVQQVIYTGSLPLSMAADIRHENLTFHYRVIDMLDLDFQVLLRSPAPEDNVLAILCRFQDSREAVRLILARIAQLPPPRRADALSQLLVLSGLRALENVIVEETARMPIDIDIMENRVIRDIYLRGERKGREEGEQKGEQKGREEGQTQGAKRVLLRQLEQRFGPLPDTDTARLRSADLATLEGWSLRLLDARSLADVWDLS